MYFTFNTFKQMHVIFAWYTASMFETHTQEKRAETVPFLAWFSRNAEQGSKKAAALVQRAERRIPGFVRLAATPQSAPWHCEGSTLTSHVERVLTVLFAVEAGASLAEIEEFARERDLILDIAALEVTVRAHTPLLAAFALVHDIAKPDTVFFDAEAESKGAREGFVQHGKRQQRAPSKEELQRYDKLLRAYKVGHDGTIEEQIAGFYAQYGIATHYEGHARVAALADYAASRDAALDLVDVPRSYHKLLAELIRQHINVIESFCERPDAKKYEFLVALAGKLGLNVDLSLDLTLAAAFLDATAGSVSVREGKLAAQTGLVVNILRAEREAAPRRHASRVEAAARAHKQARKDVLAVAGLSGEEVFALLGTPIGPERGEVMAKVQAMVQDPSLPVDFGIHTKEIARRVAVARDRLRGL